MFDLHIQYSVFTVDRCNGRDLDKIRETKFFKFFMDLTMPSETDIKRETNQ